MPPPPQRRAHFRRVTPLLRTLHKLQASQTQPYYLSMTRKMLRTRESPHDMQNPLHTYSSFLICSTNDPEAQMYLQVGNRRPTWAALLLFPGVVVVRGTSLHFVDFPHARRL